MVVKLVWYYDPPNIHVLLRYVHDSTFDRWFVSACRIVPYALLRSPPNTGLNTMVNNSNYTPPATRAHYLPGCWIPCSPYAYAICNIITPSQTTAIQPPLSSTLGKLRRYAQLMPISALLTFVGFQVAKCTTIPVPLGL